MKLLQWFLFAGLLVMPLMDGGVTIIGIRVLVFNLYFVALFSLSLVLLARQASLPLRKNPLTIIIISILFLSWLGSLIPAPHIDVALLGTIKNIQLLIIAIILVLTVKKVEDIRFYIIGVLGSMVWVSFIGWVQTFLGNGAFLIRKNLQVNAQHYFGNGFYGTRTVTAFNDPIMSGYYLAVGFCIAFALLLISVNNRTRIKSFVLVTLIIVPLLTSGSRGPIFASILTAIFLLLTLKGIKFLILALIITGLVAAVVIGYQFNNIFSNTIFQVLIDRLGFGLRDKRLDYWSSILTMAKSFPFGVGIDNFVYIAPSYIPNNLLLITSNSLDYVNMHAESMYFTQLIELGWLGFIAFLGLVGISLMNCWKFFSNSLHSLSELHKVVGASLLCAWICSSITMITTYGYNNTGIAMLFWVLVGLSLALANFKLTPLNKNSIKVKGGIGFVRP